MKKTIALTCLSLLALSACQNAGTSTTSQIQPNDNLKTILSQLQKGYTVKGSIEVNTSYYENEGHDIPMDGGEHFSYYIDHTYQNNNDYVGVDRRFFETTDGQNQYVYGENAYSNDGFVAFNYLGYDNVVYDDGYSLVDDFNRAPYASSGYINPFTLFEISDFTYDEINNTYHLNNLKGTLLFVHYFGLLDEVVDTITIYDIVFDYDFTHMSLTSDPYYSHRTNLETATIFYASTIYNAEVDFTNIGTANAKEMMKAEPQKPENADMATALYNLRRAKSVTIDRHLIPYVEGIKQDQEECVTSYFDGNNIYGQVWDYVIEEGTIPTKPSASDIYLSNIDNPDELMDVYVLNDAGTGFKKDLSTTYASINGVFYYSDFLVGAMVTNGLSENIFNKNDDGSYSPTLDNLPYLAVDLFIPFIASVSYIVSGYTSSCNVYLTADGQNIDRVEVTYDYHYYSGTVIYRFFDYNTTTMPFEINII